MAKKVNKLINGNYSLFPNNAEKFPTEFLEGMNKMNLNLVSSQFGVNVAKSSTFEKRDNNTQQVVEQISIIRCVNNYFI